MAALYSVIMHNHIDFLERIIGAKHVLTQAQDLAPWLLDWRGLEHGKAFALVLPETAAQVAQIVRYALEHNIPLVPQGGNTSMVCGATPDASGQALIISTRRMNKIRAITPEKGTALVEAGVVLATLHEESLKHNMRFPLSLGAKGSATIGGLISTNAGGTQVLRFGTMRGLTLGVEAVLPDGEIYNGLVPLKKDNRGYSLNHLLIGAEGTLGIVTAATLQLVPAAADTATAWVALASPEKALELLHFVQSKAGAHIESFELIPQIAVDQMVRHIPNMRAPLPHAQHWHALLEYTHDTAGQAHDALESLLTAALERDLCQDVVIAASVAQAGMFWKIRECVAEANRAEGPNVAHDVSVAVADMPEFIAQSEAALRARFPGVRPLSYGHLGDGNIHLNVSAASDAAAENWYTDIGKKISACVYDIVSAMGGSISAEHGIGTMKRAEFGRLTAKAQLNALESIKNGLDPHGIMNPGKLIPLASERNSQ